MTTRAGLLLGELFDPTLVKQTVYQVLPDNTLKKIQNLRVADTDAFLQKHSGGSFKRLRFIRDDNKLAIDFVHDGKKWNLERKK